MKGKRLFGKRSIFGTMYKYYFESNLKNEEDEILDGDCCTTEKIIRVDPKSNFNKTTIHETCHAILSEVGLDMVIDESKIELICLAMEKLDNIFIIKFKKIEKSQKNT